MTDFYPMLELQQFADTFFDAWTKRRNEILASSDPGKLRRSLHPWGNATHVARVKKEDAGEAYSLGRKAADGFIPYGTFEDPMIDDKGDEFVITIKAKP